MKHATFADAPAVLNTNDKAMWVLGFNEALERIGLTDQQIAAGLDAARRSVMSFEFGDGSTATQREAANIAAFRVGAAADVKATDGTDNITPAAAAFVTWEDRKDTTPHEELWQAVADAAIAASGVMASDGSKP